MKHNKADVRNEETGTKTRNASGKCRTRKEGRKKVRKRKIKEEYRYQ